MSCEMRVKMQTEWRINQLLTSLKNSIFKTECATSQGDLSSNFVCSIVPQKSYIIQKIEL